MGEGLNFDYFVNFYKCVINRKPWHCIEFILLTFVLSLLPYFVVWLNVLNASDSLKRSFYGDGSMLTLCSGILCSYFTILFDFEKKKLKEVNLAKSRVIAICLFIVYALVLLQFYFCQTEPNRKWVFIWWIILFSFLLLLITLLVAAYLHFRREIGPNEVREFVEENRRKKIESGAKSRTQSNEGTAV